MLRKGIGAIVVFSLLVVVAVWAATSSQLDSAISAQQELAGQRPLDAGVHNDLGNLLALAGHLSAAEDAYRRSLDLDPVRVSALFNLALLLQQRGEGEEASQLYQRVLDLVPNHAWAHYQLGAVLEAQGDRRRAIDAYARALSLNPELAFPDVNPHAIENSLLTEAMIQAYNGYLGEAVAPRSYDDPSHVTALLLPPMASSETEEAEEAEAETDREVGTQGASRGAVPGSGQEDEVDGAVEEPAADEPAPPEPPGRVLSEQSLLVGSSTGQVTPPPGAGRSAARRPRDRSRFGPQPSPREAGGTRPGGGFQPRSESTGRLELDLAPDSAPLSPALALLAG